MGDTWITDMRHFLDVLDPDADIPARARRLAEYLGKIVEVATKSEPFIPVETDIRCRRRPGRRPCPGHIRLVCNEDVEEILWECTSCDDKGAISGWQGTPWDRSLDSDVLETLYTNVSKSFDSPDSVGRNIYSDTSAQMEITLSTAEYCALRWSCSDAESKTSVLDDIAPLVDGFRMRASARNMVAFRDFLFDIGAAERNPSIRQLLGQVLKKLCIAIDAFLDEIF